MDCPHRRLQTYVALPWELSARQWAERHARDDVPDASPWGLHRLENSDIGVQFSDRTLSGPSRRIAGKLRHRTGGMELLATVKDVRNPAWRSADVTLCYDERTGIPAGLMSRSGRVPPVVTGIGWLTTAQSARPALARLAHLALPHTAAVFTQNAPMLPVLEQEWRIPAGRLHYVPVGIDTDFYCVQPLSKQPDLVVSAGEDRYRDHDTLVEAVLRLRRRRRTVGLELATSLPVDLPSDAGRIHSERLNGRMRDLYRRASVVAVALWPTITGSGLTVILEAMSSGRPVVATNNPGIADYVEDGVTGILVPPGDVDALAEALETILTDPDQAEAMGRAGAERARERYTSSIMAAHIADVLRSVR